MHLICDFRQITKTGKIDDTALRILMTNMTEVSSVAMCREIFFAFGKKLYMGFLVNDQRDLQIYIYIYIYMCVCVCVCVCVYV